VLLGQGYRTPRGAAQHVRRENISELVVHYVVNYKQARGTHLPAPLDPEEQVFCGQLLADLTWPRVSVFSLSLPTACCHFYQQERQRSSHTS
jgi:hypothetical protein